MHVARRISLTFASAISCGRVFELAETRENGPWRDCLAPRTDCLKISRELDMEAPFKIQNEFHLDATKFGDLADLPLDEREDASLRHLLHVRFNAPTP